tara:strand:+ start:353 stop:550 length:198 start_codon:yes stop_codon:yes gene_type:complete
MIKVGDKVAPFNLMSEVGTVVELIPVRTNTWMVGGTAAPIMKARVVLEGKNETKEYLVSDIMRVE